MLPLRGHAGSVRALAFSPDGSLLASTGDDGDVRFWDGSTGESVDLWECSPRANYCLAFAPDGRTALAAGAAVAGEGIIHRWGCPGREPRQPLGRLGHDVVALAASPDGLLVAAGAEALRGYYSTGRAALALFDALTGQNVIALDRGSLALGVWSLAFSPDSSTLAVGRANGEVAFVRFLGERNRHSVAKVLNTGVGVRALAYSPDGRTLVISPATPLLIYDTEYEATRLQVGEPRHAIESLAFCPDSATLATGCQDSAVRLIDVHTGEEKACYDWQLGPIYAVAVSPDGMRAAAGGLTGEVILFDIDL